MKRILIFLIIAVALARVYDIHTQSPEASVSQILTMLAPLEFWVSCIVLWSTVAFIRRRL
jgi:hypothetical protein